jgi:hypothetical protein
MPCFDVPQMKWLRTDWFSSKTDAQIRALRGNDLQLINAHINIFFDAHIINRSNRICVPINCPNPWPPALASVWHAAGMDEEEAAMFLGNLYCRVAIKRPEKWWTAPIPYLEGAPRQYHLASDYTGPKPKPRS